MTQPTYSGAARLSIVWAVTLAILTLMEWRQLDRDPLDREILSPFIEREVRIQGAERYQGIDDLGGSAPPADRQAGKPTYIVEFHFNGPLFLLCFFGPLAVFHGVAHVLSRLRNP